MCSKSTSTLYVNTNGKKSIIAAYEPSATESEMGHWSATIAMHESPATITKHP